MTFTIEPATRVAVVGATGSGKTTLAKLLTRLADPSGGAILVGGVDLRDISIDSLRRTMVMVPQDAFLFDTTILENVRFGRRGATDEDVRLAFVELGLEGWLATLADGLDTRVGERGEHLSAGERQLVALRVHTSPTRPCLVLDEATSRRRPRHRSPVWHAPWKACRGGARPSRSPTASRRRRAPTGSSSSRTAASSSRDATPIWSRRVASTPRCRRAGSTPRRRRPRRP